MERMAATGITLLGLVIMVLLLTIYGVNLTYPSIYEPDFYESKYTKVAKCLVVEGEVEIDELITNMGCPVKTQLASEEKKAKKVKKSKKSKKPKKPNQFGKNQDRNLKMFSKA